MNATEAKELLNPIPKENFITKYFTDFVDCCCSIGHLVRLKSKNPSNFEFSNCHDLSKLVSNPNAKEEVYNFARIKVKEFLNKKYSIDEDMALVNNTTDINGYNQDNPKDRVIHLLDDMIDAGY